MRLGSAASPLTQDTTADPMDRLGGPAAATRLHRYNNRRIPPTAESFLAMFQPLSSSSSASQPLELSEDDIFSTASCGSPPPSTRPLSNRKMSPDPSTSSARSSYGILAVLNDNDKTGSGPDNRPRPVVNRKAPVSASLASSLSVSSASSASSRILIPRLPPSSQVVKVRLLHQSAPLNVPVMPVQFRRRVRELNDVVSEGEDGEDANGVILPPHEVVASKYSPMPSCSVLEGAGRTLKGRDLRQVRHAVWRQTGFID